MYKAKGNGKGKGHCIPHQFQKKGCKREGCVHRHDSDRLARFAEAADGAGRKACGYFAVMGSCWKDDCPMAHIEIEGARSVGYSGCRKSSKSRGSGSMSRNRSIRQFRRRRSTGG